MKGYPFFLGIIVTGIIIQLVYPMIFSEALEVEAFFETIALVGLIATVDCNDSLVDLETKLKKSFWNNNNNTCNNNDNNHFKQNIK